MFMTMYALKQGASLSSTCLLFCEHESSATRWFVSWVRTIAIFMRREMPYTSRANTRKLLPSIWVTLLSNRRIRLVLDATEWEMETPSEKSANRTTFSTYKHRNTVKFLLGISPEGSVVYTSEGHGGSLSDVRFIEVCGLLFALEEGDDVMADKGFMIHHLLATVGAGLVLPPKLYNNQDGFTSWEVGETEKVAHIRIHVERAMCEAKRFGVLQRQCKIAHADLATDIFTICALMSNFNVPLVGGDFN
jgi:hypothetical protein